MSDFVLRAARELAIAVAVAAAAQLAIALAFFAENTDVVLADPMTWAIGVAAAGGRVVLAALAVKVRELIAEWMAARG